MTKKLYRRAAITTAVTAALVTTGLGTYVLGNQRSHASDPPALVATGTLEADEITVSTKVTARVAEVLVSEGQMVKPGDVLFRLDVSDLHAQRQEAVASVHDAEARLALLLAGARQEEISRARAAVAEAEQNLQRLRNGSRPEEVLQAEGSLRVAKAAHEQAEREYQRVKLLRESGDVPRRRMEIAEAELEAAKGRYEVSKQQLALVTAGPRAEEIAAVREKLGQAQSSYQLVLSGSRPEEITAARSRVDQVRATVKMIDTLVAEAQITAPAAGPVTDVVVRTGEVIRPGQPMATVVSSKKWVDVYIEENKAGVLALGAPAEMTLRSFPGKVFTGRVTSINETRVGERQTKDTMDLRSLRVRIGLNDGESRLRPGMSAEVKLFPGNAS